MEKHIFNNQHKISKIGLGLAALGRPGYINLGHGEDFRNARLKEAMQKRCIEVLNRAFDLGINYFDAARSYGLAEKFLSEWIKIKQPENVVIGSKWGYKYTADWKVEVPVHEVKEHSIANLKTQAEETNDILGKHLDIYHIHSATLQSGVLDNNEVIDELWQMKENGIIIGLSVSGAQQSEVIEKALTLKSNEQLLFGSVQATFNILETSTEAQLEKAHNLGLGIIVKEGVANGRLTNRNLESSFQDKRETIQNIAEKHNVEMDAIALAFILSKPWVSTVLSGASTNQQLESNCMAAEINLSEQDTLDLMQLTEKASAYWETRKGLAWN